MKYYKIFCILNLKPLCKYFISFLFFIFLILSFNVINAQTVWSLIWSDEFNDSIINSANWTYDTAGWGWGNHELEYYTTRPENACVKNGNLLIIAKKESYDTNKYTSARLKTLGLQSWTYGKIEARIKLPQTKGLWPAFWMLGDNFPQVGWLLCGEIDIMEHVNDDSYIVGTIHWYDNGHVQEDDTIICDVSEYHNYSIEWGSDTIKWLLDDKMYFEQEIIDSTKSPFHKPFFILLNMAIGGPWPGYPDSTSVFPDTMFVDYVRVYEDVTSVNRHKQQLINVSISPNPVSDRLNIILPGAFNLEKNIISIYNTEGMLMYTGQIEGKYCTVEAGGLPKGLYLLKVLCSERILINRFIKI